MRPAFFLEHLCRLLSALTLLGLVVAGCSPRGVTDKETEENVLREKLGLRRIQEDWICFSDLGGKDVWHAPGGDTAALKIVRRDAEGKPLLEEDRYHSGKTVRVFEAEDADLQEEVVLSYDYRTGRMELSYIGNDEDIKRAINRADSNQDRLGIVAQVRKKWGVSEEH